MDLSALLSSLALLAVPLGLAVDPAGDAGPVEVPMPTVRSFVFAANATAVQRGDMLLYAADDLVPAGAGNWTVRVTLGASALAPAAGARDDGGSGGRAPPTPTSVRGGEGVQRVVGLWRALRDLARVLWEMLRAVGALALLYHRIAPSRALDHPLRARLHALVAARAGLHVTALAEELDAHPKTVAYHLRVLARGGLVRLERGGRTTRAFATAGERAEAPDASVTRVRAYHLVRAGRARTRADLAALLGVTPQAVSYHLGVLQRQGKVRTRWLGREREYEAT